MKETKVLTPQSGELPERAIETLVQSMEYYRFMQFQGAVDLSGQTFITFGQAIGVGHEDLPWYLTSQSVSEIRDPFSSRLTNDQSEKSFEEAAMQLYRNPSSNSAESSLKSAISRLNDSPSKTSEVLSLPFARDCAFCRAASLVHETCLEEAFIILARLLVQHPDHTAARTAYEGLLSFNPNQFTDVLSGGGAKHSSLQSSVDPTATPWNMYLIKEGRVLGRRALIQNGDGRSIKGSSPSNDQDSISELALGGPSTTTPRRVKGAVALHASCAENFWHWIMQQLPRVVVAEKAGFLGTYLIPAGGGFIKESLLKIGIPSDRIEICDGTVPVVAEELYFVDHYNPQSLNLFPEIVHEIRERILSGTKVSKESKNRLYIQRSRSRVVRNEKELVRKLEKFGFRSVNFDELSFDEQLNLVSSAEAVVGPHGAAFAHALFLPVRSLIIELFSPNYVNPLMTPVNQILHHRYHMVCALNPGRSYPFGDDIEAPCDIVGQILAQEFR